MKIRFFVRLSLLMLLTLCGCGGSSEIEMRQAQNAMNKAKSFHADSLAPTDFQKAQEAWDRAKVAEKEGRTDNAKVLFTSAKIFFGKATDIANAKHDALFRELDSMRRMIDHNFGQVKIDLSTNALSPKQKSQVGELVAEVEAGNASIQKLVAKEDLAKAVATAKEVQTKIYHAQLILAGRRVQ